MLRHLLVLLISAAASYSLAQSRPMNTARIQGIMVSAESFSRDSEKEIVELDGNVQIVYEDQHLKCDRAVINLRAKSVDASGRVMLVTPKATVGGDRIILDYDNDTGVIFNGYVQSGSVLFEGELIQKMSSDEYLTSGSRYTTCTNCPETWSFSGSIIRAELGGYAYIKNTVLRLGPVPVFWLPYMLLPLKSDRQTGLLSPGFEQSQLGGKVFSLPFFWAINRSEDATIVLKNYELRGLKSLLNYRYALTEKSLGEMDFGFLPDRAFPKDSRLQKFLPAGRQGKIQNRWFLKYRHYYDMPEGFVHRVNVNNASDLQYPKDFTEETGNHGDSSMETRMSLTKNTLSQHYMVDASYYTNLMQSNPLASNEFAVHRAPELAFSQKQTKIADTNYLYSVDVNYVKFARNNFSYDDMNAGYISGGTNNRHIRSGGSLTECNSPEWEKHPECYENRDGTYDPAVDMIRTGQRLDVQPALYRPFQIGSFDFLPKLSYRETQYTFEVGDNRSNVRRYVRGDISARTTFSGIFGDLRSVKSDRIKHEIQPEVSFTTIPWMYHPAHPFFGESAETQFSYGDSISDSDLNGPNGLQFDYNDRVYDRKLMTFAVVNRLIEKKWRMGIPQYRQFLTWRLAQSYDFYQAERNPNGETWSDLVSDFRLYLDNVQIYQRANYFPQPRVTNMSSRVRLLNDIGDYIEVGHLLSYITSTGATQLQKNRTEEIKTVVKKQAKWVNLLGQVTYDVNPPAGKEFLKSWGYGAQLKMPGDCLFLNLVQYQITGGDTIWKLDFVFFWDGNERPTMHDSILQRFEF